MANVGFSGDFPDFLFLHPAFSRPLPRMLMNGHWLKKKSLVWKWINPLKRWVKWKIRTWIAITGQSQGSNPQKHVYTVYPCHPTKSNVATLTSKNVNGKNQNQCFLYLIRDVCFECQNRLTINGKNDREISDEKTQLSSLKSFCRTPKRK